VVNGFLNGTSKKSVYCIAYPVVQARLKPLANFPDRLTGGGFPLEPDRRREAFPELHCRLVSCHQPYDPSASGLVGALAVLIVSDVKQRLAVAISASVAPLLRAHASAAASLYFAT
jgi:hypothetical protein